MISGGSDLKQKFGRRSVEENFELIIFMRGVVNIVVELYVYVASVYRTYIHVAVN